MDPTIHFGIILSISEVIFSIVIASLVKLIAIELSIFLILFFRYLFCIPLLLSVAIVQRGRHVFKIKSRIGLLVRTGTGMATFGTLFAALQYIDLSLMTILLQTMPLFATILAPLLIKEVVGWVRVVIAFIGFSGVIVILYLSSSGWMSEGALLGILCPFFGALMVIFLRRLGQTDHPTSVAL